MKRLIMILVVAIGLFGCSKEGGGSNPISPSEPANITGSYSGNYQSDNVSGYFGKLYMSITQDGSSFSGAYSIESSFCPMSGNLSGTISGESIEWNSSEAWNFKGAATIDGDTISGNYEVDSKAAGCTSDMGGTLSLTKD